MSMRAFPSTHVEPDSIPAVDALLQNGDAWPSLRAGSLRAYRAAVEKLAQHFIAEKVSYRCGRLPECVYMDFVPILLTVVAHRLQILNRYLSLNGMRLQSQDYELLLKARQRLQSLLEEADAILAEADRRANRSKSVTFSKPLAYRRVRPSNSPNRWSLRTVTDGDDTPSLTTAPSHIAMEISQEEEEAEHHTGRASGVYYGDLFQTPESDEGSCERVRERRSLSGGRNGRGNPSTTVLKETGFIFQSFKQSRRSRTKTWRLYWVAMLACLVLMATGAWFSQLRGGKPLAQ